MANSWGYPVVQTDRAGLWLAGGVASISDGYGTAVIPQVPSGIISSVKYNGSTGNYTIILDSAWYALVSAQVSTVLPSGSSPACLVAQVQKSTVGDKTVLPKSAGGVGQGVTFQIYNPSTLAAAQLPSGASILFMLELQQSSA